MNPFGQGNFQALARAFDKKELGMFHLGMLLREQLPMNQALIRAAAVTEHRGLKASLARTAQLLSDGNSESEVFSAREAREIPAHYRYILASPIPDNLKGRLLSDWKRPLSSAGTLVQYLYFPVQTMAFAMMTCMVLIMFVLPQFREIMLGLRIKTIGVSDWVIEGASSSESLLFIVLLPIGGLALISLVFFLARIVFRVSQNCETLSLLSMLAAVPAEHRMRVLEIMAVKHNFPRLSGKLRAFARAVTEGEQIVPAAESVGLDSFTTWFVQLAAVSESGDEILLQGAALVETRLNGSLERSGRLIEVVSALAQGLVFGVIVYSVFKTMVVIMLAAII